MKKLLCVIFMISCLGYSAYASDVEDDSIIDALDQENTQVLDIDYSMKSFDSCDAFEDVMETYIKSYWENNYTSGYIRRGIPEVMNMEIMEDSVVEESAKSAVSDSAVGGADDFSQTNTQVLGVDESDIVKTDGTYHYYYNETQKAVYVVSSDSELEIIKKINLPKTFYGPELYVSEGRLVIIASGYSNTDYSKRGYYINRNSKTYTIVYDTSDIQAPELIKFYSSDGDVSRTRRIGDHVYVISRNYINFPYWSYKDASDIELDASLMLPQKIDISKTSEKSAQNLSLKGTDFPYNVVSGDVSGCEKISYSFPDEETLKNTNFNPGYNIISVINIESPEQKVETHVVAGSNSEIYMSTENLYMTEAIWQPNNFSCPQDALCAMPFFWGGSQNTLVHKLSVDEREVEYQNTALVPGSPLSQYSMDEYEGNFRIITSQWSPERSTGLYILDKDLKSLSSLTELAPGETFQSSRFIGDKLFLVTFEQIDPLFAIDVGDPKKPEILGELKIPGFSTYLHPYDDEHLIGLGYDTQLNQWGGTQTAGVKLDLYKINYDKKCGDEGLTVVQEEKCESGDYKGIIVEQKYSETLGGKGSYSEALNNPRMFIWNKNRNTLLLPASLYEKDDQWKTLDYYNGLFSIQIDKDAGIQVLSKTTHIDIDGLEEKRQEECKKYSISGEPFCRELLDGTLYCEDESEQRGYVPNYCFKDATIWQYVGDKSWEFNDMQIKRALYIGDSVYSFSDSKLQSHSWDLDLGSSREFK